MNKYFLLFLHIFAIGYHYGFSKKVICDSHKTIQLKPMEIIFIESPNFPNSMTSVEKKNCNMRFVNTEVQQNLTITLVLTNGKLTDAIINGSKIEWQFYDSKLSGHQRYWDNNTITLSFTNETSDEWNAFQGYVTTKEFNSYPLWNEKCIFAKSRSKSHNVMLTDETNVVTMWQPRDYLTLAKEDRECSWNFSAPNDFGFKILVEGFLEFEEVIVKSGESSLTLNRFTPYYFNDTQIQIIYGVIPEVDNLSTLIPGYENGLDIPVKYREQGMFPTFLAYVSLVKYEKPVFNDGCILTKNGSILNWRTHYKNGMGYPNNAHCIMNTEIKSGHQLYATFNYFFIENFVDRLITSFPVAEIYNTQVWQNNVLVFSSNSIDYDTIGTWEFISDGSIQKQGFNIDFENIECRCNDAITIIPCEGEYNYSIMGHDSYHYCANIDCNFTIIMEDSCLSKNVEVKIISKLFEPSEDSYHLIADGKTLLKSNEFTYPKINLDEIEILEQDFSDYYKKVVESAVIVAGSKTTFHFKSGSGIGSGYLRLMFSTIKTMTFLPKIVLTKNVPIHVVELHLIKENSALTIEMSKELLEQNDFLEIVHASSNMTNSFECITLHQGHNFSDILGNLNTYNGFDVKSLTIYRHSNCPKELIVLVVRANKAHSSNCILSKTVVNIADHIKKGSNISMAATSNGPCNLILLNDIIFVNKLFGDSHIYVISKFWTNSLTENVKFISGINKSEILFEFNQQNASVVNSLVLNTLFYTIIIPINKSIIFELISRDEGVMNLDASPQTFYQTPFFGYDSVDSIETIYMLLYKTSLGRATTVIVNSIDLSPKGFLFIVEYKMHFFSNSSIIEK